MSDASTAALFTSRLAFRRFTEADAQLLFDLDSDPEVMRWLTGGSPTLLDVVRSSILPRFLGSYDASGAFGAWVALERSSGACIGWFNYVRTGVGIPVEAHLGYRLRREMWGHGYATEGARFLVDRGFREYGVIRVSSTTYEHNLASRRVLEKVGLRITRRFRPTAEELKSASMSTLDTQEVWDGDELEYALTLDEWREQIPPEEPG